MYTVFNVVLVSLALCFSALALPLTPCPDCEKSVSPRACFCPFCGCPGDAIAASVRPVDQEVARAPDRLIRIDTDTKHGFAIPVEMADGLFAIASLDFLLGAETLTLSFVFTNTPIAYAMPEVAVDTPLVRFPLTETNLAYWCAAPRESSVATYVGNSTVSGLSFDVEPTVRSIAAASSATNLVAFFVDQPHGRELERFHDALLWQRIQPKVFREQAHIFEKMRRGEAAIAPQPWCHPIFDALLKRASVKEE